MLGTPKAFRTGMEGEESFPQGKSLWAGNTGAGEGSGSEASQEIWPTREK